MVMLERSKDLQVTICVHLVPKELDPFEIVVARPDMAQNDEFFRRVLLKEVLKPVEHLVSAVFGVILGEGVHSIE